jgi:polyketide biosynthesis enoyl-CoA hydratase PksH
MSYQTIRVRTEGSVCFLQLFRPEANNTINDLLIRECLHAIGEHEASVTVLVLEGNPEIFCLGADFTAIQNQVAESGTIDNNPGPMYDLWLKLATGPFISIAHVQGKVNAGGIGFVAACDVVLADENAQFSLSEMLFGLLPACVLPFLIRKTGFQKAQYLTLMTKPFPVQHAFECGLVDAFEKNSAALVRKHLLRLRHVPKKGIIRYKRYMNDLNDLIQHARPLAIEANNEVFNDADNLNGIFRYVRTGELPYIN